MASDANRRPDPDELLRRIQAEEKSQRGGRLKIFLGYASRVGKSFRMLDEGRRRKQRGQDVVVGAIQSELTPDVEQMLKTLDVIPTLQIAVEDRVYEVMDLVAILRRRPQVCLVDGLAYDNPPGSPNRHRWQDVKELLENGITVVTAVNLQHIIEQQDAVEKITGKRAAQTVPEEFVRAADEIVLVDAPPLDVRQRDAAHPADTRRLSELRELALLLAAEVVEGQLQRYLQSHGMETMSGSQERILVCVTPRSNAARMLRSGRYTADRFHCDLLALYVRQNGLSPDDEAVVESHLALARKLGAKVHVVDADEDSAHTILEFARTHGVTQLFVGHSMPGGWRGRLSRSPLDRLIQTAENMDLRIFPHQSSP